VVDLPSHPDLLAGAPPTLLPEDPVATELAEADRDRMLELIAAHPASSLGWALLAEEALDRADLLGDLTAYAYARTGYHRGLDALRRAGWKGQGAIPWEHESNRGFLCALWALSVAAGRIGEEAERDRCAGFLHEATATGYAELSRR
jgi:hypothetical protein